MKKIVFTTVGVLNCFLAMNAQNILINELDADQTSTDTGEFIELYDGGVGVTSLDGYVLVLFNGSDDLSYEAFDLDGYETDEKGFFVIGNAAVPGVDLVFSNTILQNGPDAVALYEDEAGNFPEDSPITLTNLVDAVVYDTNDADDDNLLALLNAGQPQLNEDGSSNKDLHSLQRYPDGAGGSRNTSSFVTAVPTPGMSNTNVPTVMSPIQNRSCRCVPNPFDTYFTVQSNTLVNEIEVYSESGQCMTIYRSYHQGQKIVTGHWPQGIYMVTVAFKDGSQHIFKVRKK